MKPLDAQATYIRPLGSEWKSNRDSIIHHFNWCDFQDPIGHPLTLNMDFIDIIDELIALRQGGAHDRLDTN